MKCLPISALALLLAGQVHAQDAQSAQDTRDASPTLSLDEALRIARDHAPEIRAAVAAAQAAHARVGIARAPMLPQVTGTASYAYGVFNNALLGATDLNTRNSFTAGIRASQLIYDFGQTYHLKDAAIENAKVQENNQHTTELDIAFGVRTAYLSAGANRALIDVAKATLANQERHLAQIQGFVDVGTRPPIDLAQSRTDVANAKLALIRAENDYASARAQLSRSIGTPNRSGYEITPTLLPPEESETAGVEALVKLAEARRPEFTAVYAQVAAQEATLASIRGQYGPSLNLTGNADVSLYTRTGLATNASVGVSLNWPFYQGELTNSRVDEAKANLTQLEAQADTLRQDLRVDVTQADLAIQAAKAALVAADELVSLAKERVTLADGRYQTGVGNIIELGDAELALRDAQTQHVSAEYDLATARASLHRTLGRP